MIRVLMPRRWADGTYQCPDCLGCYVTEGQWTRHAKECNAGFRKQDNREAIEGLVLKA